MKDESMYINRELSWLDFDLRVLALAKEKSVPLAERLKFASIYGSNMDEFFMVRVGSLYDQTLLKSKKKDGVTGLSPQRQLAEILPRYRQLQLACDKYYEKLVAALEEEGYHKINFEKLTKDQEHFWKKYFDNELFPVLSPQIIDERHPFPFLRNKEIYYCAQLKTKEDGTCYGIIPISSQFDRLLYIRGDKGTSYGFVEELIYHYGASVFDKKAVQKQCLIRATRNADISVQEGMLDHDVDFRQVMTELLKKRRKLAAVRLQFWPQEPQEVAEYFSKRLMLPQGHTVAQTAPLDLSCLMKLSGKIAKDDPSYSYPPARPMQAPASYSLAEQSQKEDVLLFYPYQSIRPFIRMLHRAASDPEVISIKMTLYRLAEDSQIISALVEAAENGKEVLAVVELRARFDEQNNIDWSRQLEEAGCNVIYGFEDYKVHSKLTLITRKSGAEYQYTTQIGTGNYNEKTSELYTDLSFITNDQQIGEEANLVFNNLAVQRLTEENETEKLLVAPLRFKSVILEEMDQEIRAAMAGKPASMILKNNSVNDLEIIDKISQASCAGVQVDMIVRGICCMKAGMPGKTENVRIRSLVGRYLEHSRIYCFGQGEDMRVYIASADFLTRNTERRVEVGVRVDDPKLKQLLYSILTLQLRDNVNAREMRPDGSYLRVKGEKGSPRVDSQMAMYDLFRDRWACGEEDQPPQPVAPEPVKAIPERKKAAAKRRPAPKKPLWQRWVNRLVNGKK